MTLYDPLVPVTLLAGGALRCLLRICNSCFPRGRSIKLLLGDTSSQNGLVWKRPQRSSVLTSKRHALLSCDVARNEVVNSKLCFFQFWGYKQKFLSISLAILIDSTSAASAQHSWHDSFPPFCQSHCKVPLQGVGSIYSWGGYHNTSVNCRTLLFPCLILVCLFCGCCSVVHASYASFGKAIAMLYQSTLMLLFWTATALWCPHKLLAMLTALEGSTVEMSNLCCTCLQT